MIAIELTAAIDAAGTLKKFYFASEGFTTKSTDTPAKTNFIDKIEDPGSIGLHAFSHAMTGGFTDLETGEIVLLNIDGEFDAWRTYSFDGRPVVIRYGTPGAAYPSGFITLMSGTVEGCELTWGKVIIRLKDKQHVFSKPVLTTKYAGNNVLPAGIEGTADDIKGRVKPRTYGRVLNINPPCVNTSKLVFQVNDGAVSDITAVYDRGASLTKGTNHANNAALLAATPAANTYDTCFAEGLFRLGSTPAGEITADVTEKASAADMTIAQIVKRLGLAAGLSSGEISNSDVTALDLAVSGTVGIWISDESKFQDAMDELTRSASVFYGFDQTGTLRMSQLAAPSGSPVANFKDYDILDGIERRPAKDNPVPIWEVTARHSKIWLTQPSDVAGSLTYARKEYLKQEFRSVVASDASVKTQFQLAQTMSLDTLFTTESPASTEATRLLNIFKVPRDVFEIPVDLSTYCGYNPKLMDVVNIVFPRFSMTSGRLFRLLGYRFEFAANRVIMTVWG